MSGPENRRRIAISGASGFLGSTLSRSLQRDGIEVIRLVRHTASGPGEIEWHPDRSWIDAPPLEGMDGVVHLAGESIAGIWTAAKKRRIMESRASGTRVLVDAIAGLQRKPKVLVSASGVGYYGDAGDTELTETHPPGDNFLAQVCVAWEAATKPAAEAGIRVVNTRFGLVMDPRGGALRIMLPAFRFGLGARLGNGRQWLSWIALVDLVSVIRFALDTENIRGGVNATAPEPIRNRDFTEQLARAVHRPAFFVAPESILRAATGGMAEALLLSSQRAVPSALQREGFTFQLPSMSEFLRHGLDGTA